MINKKQLNLPKKDKEGNSYLSYSQIATWKKSKREYMRQYFFGESFQGNEYTDFGSMVGEALEKNDFKKFTEQETNLLETIPRYDEFEREIKWELDGLFIKGFLDTNTNDLAGGMGEKSPKAKIDKIADYKTAEIDKKKKDYESEDYIQLEIYAAAIEQFTGELPKQASVFLIQRDGKSKEYGGKGLTLGDKFITINKPITPERIEQVKQEIQEIAEDIARHYELFLKFNKL